jgi:hypothetical protein
MTIGERGDRDRAQNTAIHGGKVLRLTEDGAPAPGNPFLGKEGHKPEIFTYGNRNAQGLAIHPGTGAVWANEHGPQGGDELNILQAGKNYGWPVASYGREYGPTVHGQHPNKKDQAVRRGSLNRSGMILHGTDAVGPPVGGLVGMSCTASPSENGGLLGRGAPHQAPTNPRCVS